MKKLTMAALLLAVFALPALADGTQTPPPPPPPPEWTWNDGGITAMDSWARSASTAVLYLGDALLHPSSNGLVRIAFTD